MSLHTNRLVIAARYLVDRVPTRPREVYLDLDPEHPHRTALSVLVQPPSPNDLAVDDELDELSAEDRLAYERGDLLLQSVRMSLRAPACDLCIAYAQHTVWEWVCAADSDRVDNWHTVLSGMVTYLMDGVARLDTLRLAAALRGLDRFADQSSS